MLPTEQELNLQCAMWASYYVATYQGQSEEGAFANALSYFVGQYEGLSGQGIDQAVDEAFIVDTAKAIEYVTPVCLASLEGLGARLANWSDTIAEISARIPEADGSGFDPANPRVVPQD